MPTFSIPPTPPLFPHFFFSDEGPPQISPPPFLEGPTPLSLFNFFDPTRSAPLVKSSYPQQTQTEGGGGGEKEKKKKLPKIPGGPGFFFLCFFQLEGWNPPLSPQGGMGAPQSPVPPPRKWTRLGMETQWAHSTKGSESPGGPPPETLHRPQGPGEKSGFKVFLKNTAVKRPPPVEHRKKF